MKTYSEEEAARMLPSVLDQATKDGFIRIRRPDGSTFDLSPSSVSPLEVSASPTDVTRDEIVSWVRASRRRG
jgi:hypothetical protein